MSRRSVAFLVVMFVASALFAATPDSSNAIRTSSPTTNSSNAADSAKGFDAWHVGWALALVIGLILLLRIVARKVFPGAAQRSSSALSVLTRIAISPRQQLIIVQAGRRLIVVADTGQQISPLCEISDPEEVASMLAQLRAEQSSSLPQTFGNFFAKAAERRAPESVPLDPDLATTRAEINGLLTRVRGISRELKSNQSASTAVDEL